MIKTRCSRPPARLLDHSRALIVGYPKGFQICHQFEDATAERHLLHQLIGRLRAGCGHTLALALSVTANVLMHQNPSLGIDADAKCKHRPIVNDDLEGRM